MKSVLISIRPKWCELIASGKKTVEVRKTRPNIKTPFKCYIYCTLSGSNDFFKEDCKGDIAEWNRSKMALKKGKVIGEFVCKSTMPISVTYSDPNNKIALREFPYTCLSDKEIMNYLGNGKQGWGWHISDLVIYDKPKELSEFYRHDNTYDNAFGYVFEDRNKQMPLSRPPQSWCYIEGKEDEGK